MPYEVLARKWRPRQFDDVIGQEHVVQTLKNAIKTGRIAHAYLFVGPRGVGKTSVARIFAKALNCAQGTSVTPCDKCDSCREISAGTNLDVIEIDGASNNGVDQVRDLRDTVKYAPVKGGYKIYVIDEVHMLTVGAFNALLKTLEEPPSHVKFIFATTEPDKILATILSRCQRFDLRRIPVALIIDHLKVIAKAENVKITDDALLAIARGSEGGLRDAESALDQLVSFKGTEIVEEDVLSVFGLVSRGKLEDLAQLILSGDVKGIIEIIAVLDEGGKDLQRLTVELMNHFRNLLVCMYAGQSAGDLDVLDAQMGVLKKQAAMTDAGRLMRITDVLSAAEDKMRYALSVRTVLEMALIRCARAATVVTIDEILAQINQLKKNLSDGPAPSCEDDSAEPVCGQEEISDVESVPSSAVVSDGATAGSAELAMLVRRWPEVIDKAAKIAIGLRAFLMDARPVSVSVDRVVIGFDSEFGEEAENFKNVRNQNAVKHALGLVLKRDVAVVFQALDVEGMSLVKKEHDRMAEEWPAGLPDSVPAGGGVEIGGDADGKKRDFTRDASVRKVMEVFGGRVIEVRE